MFKRVRILLVLGLIWMQGCSRCERMESPPPAADSELQNKSSETGPDAGDEVGPTDAVETPETPKWESAVEPGIGE